MVQKEQKRVFQEYINNNEKRVIETAAQQFLIRQGSYFHALYTREDNCEDCYKGLNWQLADQNDRERYARHRAERHNHLYTHPESKAVNEQYLSDIIDMCQHENLELWVIVPPFTKEYISVLQPAFQQEFIQNLEQQPCAIQYIDFNTDLPKDYFGISDFFDMDHLNDEGAAKFTKLLLGEICPLSYF